MRIARRRRTEISTPTPTADQSQTKLPVPAWRLRKGVINASEGDLEAAASSCETFAKWCGAAVVLGLIIEVALAAKHPPFDSFIGIWGSVIADSLVALGVFGELLFSAIGSKCHGELQRRSKLMVAESNRLASEAQLEIARLRKRLGPRQINSEIFLAELAGQPKAPLEILYSPDDPDSWNLAWHATSLLVEAGWSVESPNPIPRKSDKLGNPSSVIAGGYPSGITISVRLIEENDKPGTAYTALWNAFWKGLDPNAMYSSRQETIPEGALRVIVAPRE
jgi:hypothetical protein